MINRAQITIEIKPFFIVFTFFLEFQVVEGFKRSYTAKTYARKHYVVILKLTMKKHY